MIYFVILNYGNVIKNKIILRTDYAYCLIWSWFVCQVNKTWFQGWQCGGAGLKDGVFVPAPYGFVLPHPRPVPPYMTRNTFSPHPRPLGPHEAPPHPVRLYFLLICPTTSTIFLMKPISLIKIYLKLQLNLSHQIKSVCRKN